MRTAKRRRASLCGPRPLLSIFAGFARRDRLVSSQGPGDSLAHQGTNERRVDGPAWQWHGGRTRIPRRQQRIQVWLACLGRTKTDVVGLPWTWPMEQCRVIAAPARATRRLLHGAPCHCHPPGCCASGLWLARQSGDWGDDREFDWCASQVICWVNYNSFEDFLFDLKLITCLI